MGQLVNDVMWDQTGKTISSEQYLKYNCHCHYTRLGLIVSVLFLRDYSRDLFRPLYYRDGFFCAILDIEHLIRNI